MVERGQAIRVFSRARQTSAPAVQMQRRMTAMLRATGIRALWAPIRPTRRVPDAVSGENRGTLVSTVSAAHERQIRVKASPQVEMRPCRSISPDG